MPIKRRKKDRTYRLLQWGKLAELFLLDTPQYRDPEVPANSSFGGLLDAQDTTIPPSEDMFAPGPTTLGIKQQGWIKRRLARSKAGWKVIGLGWSPRRFSGTMIKID
jgi:phosphodiesterase/alkaline phosphatase D-like protein